MKSEFKVGKFKPEAEGDIAVGFLQVIVMPNGEIVHRGKTISNMDKSAQYIYSPVYDESGAK